jgi:hypothetical protein
MLLTTRRLFKFRLYALKSTPSMRNRGAKRYFKNILCTCKTLRLLMFLMLHSECRSTVIIVTGEEPMHRSPCSVCCCSRRDSRRCFDVVHAVRRLKHSRKAGICRISPSSSINASQKFCPTARQGTRRNKDGRIKQWD